MEKASQTLISKTGFARLRKRDVSRAFKPCTKKRLFILLLKIIENFFFDDSVVDFVDTLKAKFKYLIKFHLVFKKI